MATDRTPMHKLREILRLKWVAQRSHREAAPDYPITQPSRPVAYILQRTLDPGIATRGILVRHPHDQASNLDHDAAAGDSLQSGRRSRLVRGAPAGPGGPPATFGAPRRRARRESMSQPGAGRLRVLAQGGDSERLIRMKNHDSTTRPTRVGESVDDREQRFASVIVLDAELPAHAPNDVSLHGRERGPERLGVRARFHLPVNELPFVVARERWRRPWLALVIALFALAVASRCSSFHWASSIPPRR